MNLKKSAILFLAYLGIFTGCSRNELLGPTVDINQKEVDNVTTMAFRAMMEQFSEDDQTKAFLGGSESDKVRTMLWEPGDEIFLYEGGNRGAVFVNTEKDTSSRATFEGNASGEWRNGFDMFYPNCMVDTAMTFSRQDYKIYFNLPSEQKYSEGGVASGSFPMIACKYSDDTSAVKFMNCCSIIALGLLSEGDEIRVHSIKLKIAGEKLSGLWYRNRHFSKDYNRIESTDDALDYVVLNCKGDDGKGVAVNSFSQTFFYIVIPPCSGNGIELEIKTDSGIAEAHSANSFSIAPSQLRRAKAIPYTFIIKELSGDETANSYMAPEISYYKFKAVKGNSAESLSGIASVDVLWESSGTGEVPGIGTVVKNVSYTDGYIKFLSGRDGNALIAARDDAGNILWSWHIWVCEGYDAKQVQQRYPSLDCVMDRNLGAVSSVPGDAGSNGLFYQWGRKDPFPRSGRTGNIPAPVASSTSTGTNAYATAHPEEFILFNSINFDWYYSGSETTDESRWQSEKTIYDPCPPGWKMPSGGVSGMYPTAFGTSEPFSDKSLWQMGYGGMDFKTRFGADSTVWYPAAGCLDYESSEKDMSGEFGLYWTSGSGSEEVTFGSCLSFDAEGLVEPSCSFPRATGMPVRCVRSDNVRSDASGATDLSAGGTSNSYIASENGRKYKFNAAVQGNSSDSVEGEYYKAAVLWESFGTDEVPVRGDVVRNVGLSADNYIVFTKGEKDGNAVIAMLDSRDNVLWSWHVWACKDYIPSSSGQTYYDGSVMMDRNLGAITASPGERGIEGLLYQWGRKDPFLGADLSGNVFKSTIEWPQMVKTNENGTIEYSIAHPTTFMGGLNSGDWLYYPTGDNPDTTRWQRAKTKYDPCPPGWSVPDGGPDGMWAEIMNTDKGRRISGTQNNYSVNLHGIFGDNQEIWYPYHYCYSNNGQKSGWYGNIHTSSSDGYYSYWVNVWWDSINPDLKEKSYGLPVRCRKVGTGSTQKKTYTNLSGYETANSYIVSQNADVKIDASVPGNGSSVYKMEGYLTYNTSYAEVLWESDGTAVTPSSGSIITDISYNRNYIRFRTGNKDGNAVVALKDYDGTVLWSWHIWVMNDYDSEANAQNYNEKAIFMDRNLGALSLTPGDGKALGLLYQWGRKDPFLGSADKNNSSNVMSSGMSWPAAVESTSENGTMDYAVKNPQTFIKGGTSGQDWQYTPDRTLWAHSKTIYDPCPPGWVVPDGNDQGQWASAAESTTVSSSYWDAVGIGYNFSGKFGTASNIWYPAVPYRDAGTGDLSTVDGGFYSTVTSSPYGVGTRYGMKLSDSGAQLNYNNLPAAAAVPVRCRKMGFVPKPEGDAINLSESGTANCYIVNQTGKTYQFYAKVKGSTDEAIEGTPVSAEVLWESFGTSSAPERGSVIASTAEYGSDGYIKFKSGQDGNAVIVLKDASGKILWSWHIWVCEGYNPLATQQHYYNSAGIVMDRNLGATSAVAGDVRSLGLFYQWGRKDPFLPTVDGSSQAASSIKWPEPVDCSSETGTIEYTIANPSLFIKADDSNGHRDWLYNYSAGEGRWNKAKTEYDPCPSGWRVSSTEGLYDIAQTGSTKEYADTWDSTNRGNNFAGYFGADSNIWYPATGYLDCFHGYSNYSFSMIQGYNHTNDRHHTILFFESGWGHSSYSNADAMSVRCQKIGE